MLGFNYITYVNFLVDILVFLIGVGLILGMFLAYKKWKKKVNEDEKKLPSRYSHLRTKTEFSDWMDEHIGPSLICIIVGAVMIIISIVACGCDLGAVYKNRVEEPARYEYAIMQKATLEDALKITKDVVNTELYSKAINYNSQLAELKTKYTLPQYKLNFTGNYDWQAMEYIDLTEK